MREGEEKPRKLSGGVTKLRHKAEHVAPPPLIPEQRLCIAIINMAITDYLGPQTCEMSQAEKREARNFIFREEAKEDWNFSFLCESIGLDAAEVRKALIKIIATQQTDELVRKLKGM